MCSEHPSTTKESKTTHRTSGASLSGVYPPIISLAHTSLKNQPIWPTAHPIKSPAAAFHVPLMTHESATSASGRYGADIVKMPKRAIGVDGCRLDHMYIGTKAREDERNGRLTNGDSAWRTKLADDVRAS